MDIAALIARLTAQMAFTNAARLPGMQIGLAGRRYLGAELLPNRETPENTYREYGISYRTVMANTGTRYSPVVLEEGVASGSMLVELGEIDIGSEFRAQNYDNLLELLRNNRDMDGQAQVMNWVTTTLSLPIQERIEKQRWEAIDDALVSRRGANNYREDVAYPNPTGHRITVPSGTVAAPGGWYSDAYDPFDDIEKQRELLASKGFTVSRIITSTRIVGRMLRHPKVRQALGGGTNNTPTRISREALSGYMQENGLPGVEIYDLTARTAGGTTVRFKREDAFTMVAQTGRGANIALPNTPVILANTLGYAAVGRAAGQRDPGVVVRVEAKQDKPPRLEGEAWATAAPVILDPEAIAVINVPTPA